LTLLSTSADPIPEGAVVDWVVAPDGTRLRVAHWCPPDTTRGTVVLLNGRSEFIEKYFEVIAALLARGFAVATLDWRGQGLSDRPLPNRHKGHVEHFDLYVSDLRQIVDTFITPSCPAPFRAVCHSMGGNIGLRYIGAHPETFAAALFSAPMWGIGKAARTTPLVRTISLVTNLLGLRSPYVPGTGGDWAPGAYPFEGNTLTNDRTRFERAASQVVAEPRLALGGPTLGWVTQAIASMDVVHGPGFAEAIEIPITVCSAEDDALVSVDAQRLIAERLPNARHVVLEGARHELLMELDEHRDRVFIEFDSL
jgi:lysophospholipase